MNKQGNSTLEKETVRIWNTTPVVAMAAPDWYGLVAVLALAISLRILFYTGFFGSDEVTYVESAVKIASGDWRASSYIGATRYGMNLPVALSVFLFGLSEASANLWPFLCSVAEIAVVFAIARGLWGTREAILGAGLLALLPLHVHFAGRMMADPPLAFFLSLSVACLLRASRNRHWSACFAAGLAWGGVFWVKESVALLYLPVFVLLSLFLNGLKGRWHWLFAGVGLAMAPNFALMYLVAGNPMHVFAVMKTSLASINASATLETSPWYYLRYLFMDIRHTFLLGFLVVAGITLYARHSMRDKQAEPGTRFVALWVFLVVGMFSIAVVSLTPLQLVMKQTNYMLIFAGPLALLAGWFLATLPTQVCVPLLALIGSGSVLLAALEQQAVAVFTSNSRAAYVFLRNHPDAYIAATTNNVRAINFFSMMEGRRELRERVLSFGDIVNSENPSVAANLEPPTIGMDAYAVLDLQNSDWGHQPGAIQRLSDVPKCWTSMGILTPATLGSGAWLVQRLVAAGALLPDIVQQRYRSILQPVFAPAPAYLYKVKRSCLAKPGWHRRDEEI